MTKQQPIDPLNELLTRQQAAAYLGVSPNTLGKWASTGEQQIPYIRLGGEHGRVRYHLKDLIAFVESSPKRSAG
jgi:excisionase family DNA binding protein